MVLFVWKYVIPDGGQYYTQKSYYSCEMTIDSAESVIWCERFQDSGEFQVYMPATPDLLRFFTENEILVTRQDTDRAMILERIELTTSAENGNYLKISGRSAEGIMYQRNIEQKNTLVNYNAAGAVRYYIQENISNYWYYNADSSHPHDAQNGKRFVNFINNSSYDNRIAKTATVQPFGQNLGDFIFAMCKGYGFGFKAEFENGEIFCKCYEGDDRSLDQDVLPAVVFSEDFNNLGSTIYVHDKRADITRTLVGGEGEGKDRKQYILHIMYRTQTGEGLNIRENYVDAHSASSNSDGVTVTDYNVLLSDIAHKSLDGARAGAISFDGEILPGGQFQYRKDYFLGDTVSVRNAYGITGKATVTEVVETEDENGYRVIPKFSEWRV
jgi:hypothetical protein